MRELTMNLAQLLLTRDDPAAPYITFYDDHTGERTELSGVTMANWAAKTAGFYVTTLGLAPGNRLAITAPVHWQTLAAYLGGWMAGLEVTVGDDASAAAAVIGPQSPIPDNDEVAVLSLHPMGLGMPDISIGLTDFASEVRIQADTFTPAPASVALAGLTIDKITQRCSSFPAGARLLSTRGWDTADDVIDYLIAPLLARASLVQVAHPRGDLLVARAQSEKVTAIL